MSLAIEYTPPAPGPKLPQRIVVIGTTGSGKTTTAAKIAAILGYPHTELDALHWEADWQEAPLDVFRERVQAALSGEQWVVDGNYSKVRDLVWSRADTLVWLDYAFWTVLRQLLGRTLRRIVTREALWGSNQEDLRALVGRDSILVWMFKTYGRRRREIPILLQQREHAHLVVVRPRSPKETDAWLKVLAGRF